ncbi:MAG: hypothetical protein IPJ97_09170 [Proteobacteria bacterium]|nr:hypothetical protein [Pseudomonadota bacterium]
MATGWLAGRLLVFLAILAALVAMDAYREESTLLGVMLKGLVPDKELVQRLADSRAQIEDFARDAEIQVNQRLRDAQSSAPDRIDILIDTLQADIKVKEGRRRSSMGKAIGLMTGTGLEEDLKNEVDIQLCRAELEALKRIKGEFEALRTESRDAAVDFEDKRRRTLQTNAAYLHKKEEVTRFEWDHPIAVRVPGTSANVRLAELTRQRNRLAREYNSAGAQFYAARDRLTKARARAHADPAQVQLASTAILGPLDELIATKRAAVDATETQAEKALQSIRKVFLKAFGILVAVTLVPVGIKAFWYWFVARLAEKQRPVRLRPAAAAMHVVGTSPGSGIAPTRKISAVSQEIVLNAREELLVHPEFLQSSANRGRKGTQWLLSWRFWLTSIAAQMVALDRIRDADGESFVISSKNDAFAEVGVIDLPEDSAFVLQPRNLVGVVQSIDRPIRISRKWSWSLMAFITLQFRYLIFDGPGKLLVQGWRGVRVEQAGSGRSIDQAATFGFSANLDYAPRRSETFGAYLLGTRSLFNDRFSGGPGVYVYEEMPYFGRKSGLTGRGFEGLTDGVLKVFGI